MAPTDTSSIVDTAWLVRAVREGAPVVVVEVVDDPATRGRLAGSVVVDWRSLVWHESRRELADATVIARRLADLGAGAGSTIVLAGDPTQFAAYVLWASRVVGLDGDLRYLDGGVAALAQLTRTDVTLSPSAPALEPIAVGTSDPATVVDRAHVAAASGSSTTVVVDMRSPEEFSGARVSPPSIPVDHGAVRAGRIPGARHLHALDLLDADSRLRDRETLRHSVSPVTDGADEVILYCRLAHRAALGWLDLTDVLGVHAVRVYEGSWTEWGSVVGAPVER
ncbi:sulfurtransferase [Williamsia deligens]|uniref:Sulfurtransferase n=1 Tax=Williamsia deligens TaxID=321325 RepID=A0ABW3GBX2_9NOCA|nr:rhodanese-like domain-containing protein [Williamsia deligens]MCP2192943.1 thiosulfate/3-mercaptopyruvate sulfurtransferase [Williamsia deligens]